MALAIRAAYAAGLPGGARPGATVDSLFNQINFFLVSIEAEHQIGGKVHAQPPACPKFVPVSQSVALTLTGRYSQ